MNRRIWVRKKSGFRSEEAALLKALNVEKNINLKALASFVIYDLFNVSTRAMNALIQNICSESYVDNLWVTEIKSNPYVLDFTTENEGNFTLETDDEFSIFAYEFLEGQYDQRADSAQQCLNFLVPNQSTKIKTAKAFYFYPELDETSYEAIKHRLINPVESQEKNLDVLEYRVDKSLNEIPKIIDFTKLDEKGLESFKHHHGLVMSIDDLLHVQRYFLSEKREPTLVELKVLDTYWSDHCRHTTFETSLKNISFEDGLLTERLQNAQLLYEDLRERLGNTDKPVTLMDMASIVAKVLRKEGRLEGLELSDEINACSVVLPLEIEGKTDEWLLMFKNETHNHPTEIEPFGGASTCLGGAIRDPLSGRSFVYQALRLTGVGDINTPTEKTLSNKLPQAIISKQATAGYSSYGNQIGLATTYVKEYIHSGYVAKHMEVGAVLGLAKREHVCRKKAEPSNLIILLGGATGRDGIGGATGSSKAHELDSLRKSGSEVQKGNAVIERKIQRLFRNPECTKLIRKCNDFGAGGVAVAVGELADGLEIDLDALKVKYEGLNALERAISESQERMAVLIAKEDLDAFVSLAAKENLDAYPIAKVTNNRRVIMYFQGEKVLDLSRDFLNTNGVLGTQELFVQKNLLSNIEQAFIKDELFGLEFLNDKYEDLRKEFNQYNLFQQDPNSRGKYFLHRLLSPQVAMHQGLTEYFDASIGRSTVLMPYGGKYQKSEEEGSCQKLPIPQKHNYVSLMTAGFSPSLSNYSPYIMAAYSVVEALARLTAMGGNYKNAYLSCQEYFRRLDKNPKYWGQVYSAMLGLIEAQLAFGIAAIGGKDSMSGTFESIHVPDTLITFAASHSQTDKIISTSFKKSGTSVYLLKHEPHQDGSPNYKELSRNFEIFQSLNESGFILAASSVKSGGLLETIVKMGLGNGLGFSSETAMDYLSFQMGSIVLELDHSFDFEKFIQSSSDSSTLVLNKDILLYLGKVQESPVYNLLDLHEDILNEIRIPQDLAHKAMTLRYSMLYPEYHKAEDTNEQQVLLNTILSKYPMEKNQNELIYQRRAQNIQLNKSEVKVLIPVFPGTNCEYDTVRAFENEGAKVETVLILNRSHEEVKASINQFINRLKDSKILVFAGGFSNGDEPDGSAKFIVNFLKNYQVARAIGRHLKQKRLILGICNGFQALVKAGYLPNLQKNNVFSQDHATLFKNTIGRHVSKIVRTVQATEKSPWLSLSKIGTVNSVAVSHGEGRFMMDKDKIEALIQNGQVAFYYADAQGQPSMNPIDNPNGSFYAIEGLIDASGQILGKMGHSERYEEGLFQNIEGLGEKKSTIFAAGVQYCRKLK